jgi:hypothetical protein
MSSWPTACGKDLAYHGRKLLEEVIYLLARVKEREKETRLPHSPLRACLQLGSTSYGFPTTFQ